MEESMLDTFSPVSTATELKTKFEMSRIIAGITKEVFDDVNNRYKKYLETLDNPNELPVKVFEPLTPKQLQEIELIRQVSIDLQKKKEEEMKNVAEKAAELLKSQKKETAAAKEEEPKKE